MGEVDHTKEDLKLIYFNYPLYFPPFRMATMIAKKVVGSKVKSITKDIEGAVALGKDEEKESEAVAEFQRIKVDKGFRRNQ